MLLCLQGTAETCQIMEQNTKIKAYINIRHLSAMTGLCEEDEEKEEHTNRKQCIGIRKTLNISQNYKTAMPL